MPAVHRCILTCKIDVQQVLPYNLYIFIVSITFDDSQSQDDTFLVHILFIDSVVIYHM